jgi:phenylpropionate dioxygenase-like ring-hydroxylating dioxygenase large terminal subunit
VYRLDGALRHVPDEYGFPGLDKEARGLVAVDTQEKGGFVFVTQDPPFASTVDALADVPQLLGPDQEYLGVHEGIVEANWKVFMEGFLEGYHIKATHPDTFFPFGYDNVNVIERAGRNSRVTFPFRRIEALRDKPASEWNVDGLLTYVYQLFPNTIVAQLSHHTSIAVLEPLAPDRTRLVTYMLTNRTRSAGTQSPAARESAAKDAAFVVQGAAQDREMVERVQRGLSSGANDHIEFGRFEGALVHFHRQLRELLDAVPAPH